MQRDLVNYGPPTFVPFDAVEAELKKEPSEVIAALPKKNIVH